MHSIARVQHWKGKPGNWDVLNFSEVFTSNDLYEIPCMAKDDVTISELIAWGSRPKLLDASLSQDIAVHFFLDDYRFESLWRNPAHNLDAMQLRGVALSPDFSLWADMPLAMQIWNVYRNRWIGAYWQARGIKVIPTISWAAVPHDFCFAGVEKGSQVAISSVGVVNDKTAHSPFIAGFEKMIEVIQPSKILCYGSLSFCNIHSNIPVVEYPTRWRQIKSKMAS